MNKDYFQDIVPKKQPTARASQAPIEEDISYETEQEAMPIASERSIRNINVSGRSYAQAPARESAGAAAPRRSNGMKLHFNFAPWLLIVALGGVAVTLGALALFVFRPTTVTITPRTHTVVFDQTSQYIAYPAEGEGTASTTSLTYTSKTLTFEDSVVVPVQKGVAPKAASKATGTITVVNGYSSAPLKFVKDTRFQTPEGLIFRALSDIIVPGMQKAKPGTVDVTVVADQPGEQYNVGPTAKFTVPGLKSSASYSRVYAKSSAAMAGGIAGAEAATAPGSIDAARAQLKGSLEQKVRAALMGLNGTSTVAFANLSMVAYTDEPNTADEAGIHVHEKVVATVPVFPSDRFGSVIAQAVTADAENAQIDVYGGKGYAAQPIGATSTKMGIDPVAFAMQGTARLVWRVDTISLAKALAGRDQGAFQTISSGFSGVQESHARIEPFWKTTFPTDPAKIKITVEEPKNDPKATQ